MKILIVYILLVLSANAYAEVLRTPPGNPDLSRSYLFYLHGQIVEGSNGRPISPEYGRYEYYDILDAFSHKGFIVISEIRPKNTDPETYSIKAGDWIESLIKRGVPPGNISVIGASKGGNIAARVSSALQMPNISYVILAGLFAGRESKSGLKLSGRVLSIHDSSDKFSITPEVYFNKSINIKAKKLIITNTGLGHGMLYRPYNEWFSEALSWINPKSE